MTHNDKLHGTLNSNSSSSHRHTMSLRPDEVALPSPHLQHSDGASPVTPASPGVVGAAAELVVDQVNAEARQILEDMTLRKRRPWNPDGSLVSGDIDLLGDDDGLDDEEEEDGVGCPLPSTPEDNQLLEAEVCVEKHGLLVVRFEMTNTNRFFAIDDRSAESRRPIR